MLRPGRERRNAVNGIGRRARASSGSTLVEVLVALVLVTILVAALIHGLLVSTTATATSNREQRIDAAKTSFGESIKRLDYRECADASWYGFDVESLVQLNPQQYALPANVVGAVESVEYWRDGRFAAGSAPVGGSYGTSCFDGGSQLVTFSVSSGGRTESAQVVKRSGFGQSGGPVAVVTTTTLAPDNDAPLARFTATPSEGAAPLGVYLDASASSDDGAITSYAWDLGGGLILSGPTVSHSFAPGLYLVKLTVTDDDGATSSAYRTVNASGVPSTPTGLIKTGSATDFGGTYFEFKWTPVNGVQQYEVRLEGTDWFGWCSTRTVTVAAPASTSRILASTLCSTGLFGVEYKASIRARVGTQWSAWSAPVEVTL